MTNLKFPIGHYPEFQLPDWFNDDTKQLKNTLQKVWNRNYIDLYDRGGQAEVEPAFEEVLNAIGLPHDPLTHRRYVYMAYTMAIAAQPTVKNYYPESQKFAAVEKAVQLWLHEGKVTPNLADQLFPHIHEIGQYQAVDEAYNIFYNCLKGLDPKLAYNALLEILYDATTGDAISGFAAACRDIFNWWLIEVIPAAYCLKLPETFYSAQWQFSPLSRYSVTSV